ncbi:hypothetical protein FIBSPDRAFT_213556 [Athelia psychrophila]|uniref:Uncharacterized protein n=1 Tax=Athelia psychrophila TaxID=1759441 RepID=A0A166SBS5_9AGAM|nr:hypothetical protein FIBSPDRAFT_213556 [Fibularhizoctonia sp. CBS 109695]
MSRWPPRHICGGEELGFALVIIYSCPSSPRHVPSCHVMISKQSVSRSRLVNQRLIWCSRIWVVYRAVETALLHSKICKEECGVAHQLMAYGPRSKLLPPAVPAHLQRIGSTTSASLNTVKSHVKTYLLNCTCLYVLSEMSQRAHIILARVAHEWLMQPARLITRRWGRGDGYNTPQRDPV